MSGPFEMIGDPAAAACEGDSCALPIDPHGEAQDGDRERDDERVSPA